MSFLVYVTGYPGSGKLTVAKKIASANLSSCTVIDSHTLSNLVYRRCSGGDYKQHPDNFTDCRALAELLSDNVEKRALLSSSFVQIAQQAKDLPVVNISAGEQPLECHHVLVQKIRDIVFEEIRHNPEKSYILTNKLYAGNNFHEQLIKKVKCLCGGERKFYGFKLVVPETLLSERIDRSNRASKGKLTDLSSLKNELATKTLIRDPDFLDVDAGDGSTKAASIIAEIIFKKHPPTILHSINR